MTSHIQPEASWESKLDNFLDKEGMLCQGWDESGLTEQDVPKLKAFINQAISEAVSEERKRIREAVEKLWEEKTSIECSHPVEAVCENCLYPTFLSKKDVISLISQ